jgi:hypothetical protein
MQCDEAVRAGMRKPDPVRESNSQALRTPHGWAFLLLGVAVGLVLWNELQHGFGLPAPLLQPAVATAAPVSGVAAGFAAVLLSYPDRVARLRWRQLLRDAGIVVIAFLLYEVCRLATRAPFSEAHQHALALLRFEHAAGLPREAGLQAALVPWLGAGHVAAGLYALYFPVTIAALVWLYVADRRVYRILRNALGLSILFAVVTMAVVPVAPPRLVPESGVIDTLAAIGRPEQFNNAYAAMPSLHVGWIAAAGFCVALAVGPSRRWAPAIAVGPAVLMELIVVSTGNHFWLDGAVGAVYALAPVIALSIAGRRSSSLARSSSRPVTAGGSRRP